MTSQIESQDGIVLCETLHGSVPKHFKNHYLLRDTSTNSISTIFAWTKALHARAMNDQNEELVNFADTLEKVTIETVMKGQMTKDLA